MENRLLVRPEDLYSLETLLAAQSGKLYIDLSADTHDRNTIQKSIRAYVHRIDSLATKRFSASIDVLWDAIFRHNGLMAVIMPKPRARKCRDFDKYGVARIIGILREKGVYEQYSDRHFDALLEPDVEDSNFRKYLSMGLDDRQLVLAIKEIVVNANV